MKLKIIIILQKPNAFSEDYANTDFVSFIPV